MPLTKNNFESQIQIANWTNANGTLATWKGRATSKSFCGYYLFLLPLNWGKSQKVLFDLITRISTFSSISHHISIFIFKSHFFFLNSSTWSSTIMEVSFLSNALILIIHFQLLIPLLSRIILLASSLTQ